MPIYKNYDKAALDKQYNNRAQVPGFQQIVEGWQQRSAQLRQQAQPHLGVSYGPHEREYLDIFPATQANAPLQVFFHGGYWQALETSVFHFIAEGFTSQGITTALVNYPLAPAASMAEIIESCRRALAWLYRQAANYGADPNRLFISGHSAGGHIVAMMMATDWPTLAADLPANLIKGGCALSGLFDLVPIQLSYVNDNIGMDEVTAKRNSPLAMAPTTNSPLIIAVGALETDEYHAQSNDLATAWSAKGLGVTTFDLPDCNHFTVLEPFIDQQAELHQEILTQMGVSSQ